MQKVIVIGCCGSGKSVFSRKLHELTEIPLVHLDNLYWNEDKTTVPKTVFLERLAEAMSGQSWIIDGNYGSTMEMRIAACDTVFFLDYPTEVCMAGVMSRVGVVRSDIPWVEERSGLDAEFVEFIEKYNTESRPAVPSLLDKYSNKNIIIFKNRSESDEYLKKLKKLQ